MDRIATKPSVLVVDDEFELANVLRDLLQDYQYQVDVAYDGVQALGKIKQKTYDVILCDYVMPRMNGQLLFHTLLKSHPQFASRFVFITAHARLPEVSSFFSMLQIPHLDKPFRAAEVLRAVERILQTSKN